MVHFLFAMQREADMFDLPNKTVIGVRGTDLPYIDKNDTVVNIGLCGGYKYSIGDVVVPTDDMTEDEFVSSNIIRTDSGEHICVTARDFVEKPLKDIPVIYDMELAKLLAIPCKKLLAIKIVSDNLNESVYFQFDISRVKHEVMSILKENGLIQ